MHGAAPRRGGNRCRTPTRDPRSTTGWPGRNGARCLATPIGPIPGPPPPCGMQNVLCRLRWQTSAPMSPGPAEPDLRVHVGAVHVDLAAMLVHDLGRSPGSSPRTRRAWRDRSPSAPRACRGAPPPSPAGPRRSMLPCASLRTGTTCIPAITALAGLVPCADCGMRQVVRCGSPRDAVPGADHQQARRTPPATRRWAAATPPRSR